MVERFGGPTLAKNVQNEITNFKGPLNSIGHTQRLRHRAAPVFNLRKNQDPSFSAGKFKWMATVKKGIWIARFRGSNGVDHCVVVDGQTQEIIDSEEKKPMRLCEASLHAYGGDDAVDLYITEIRELYKSSKGTQN